MSLFLTPRFTSSGALPPPPRWVKMRAGPVFSLWFMRLFLMPLIVGCGLLMLGVFLLGLLAAVKDHQGSVTLFLLGTAFFIFWNWIVTKLLATRYYIHPRLTRYIFTHGHEATAHIVEKTQSSVDEATYQNVVYEYDDATGRRHRCEEVAPQKIWNALQIGEPLTILIHPQLPEQSRIVALGEYEFLD